MIVFTYRRVHGYERNFGMMLYIDGREYLCDNDEEGKAFYEFWNKK